MAYLNTRGTLVRDRLDFYETSNCWAVVWGNVPSGPIGAYLLNNATTSLQLDVYGMRWSSSTPQAWQVTVQQPVQTITPITPIASEVHCIQPDLPAPVGLVGMASAFNPDVYYWILRQSDSPQSGDLDIGYGTPHIVLPPGWLIVISTTAAAACELSVTFFYQAVLDNVPPAQ